MRIFTKQIVATKELLSQENNSDFLTAGFSKKHILGVITGIGVKTMNNYFNHIFNTPLDTVLKDVFRKNKIKSPLLKYNVYICSLL